jgi:NifU-like protein involved in Fe-S cluster formation
MSDLASLYLDSIRQHAAHPLLGVKPYPGRIHCATLPWSAATNAL